MLFLVDLIKLWGDKMKSFLVLFLVLVLSFTVIGCSDDPEISSVAVEDIEIEQGENYEDKLVGEAEAKMDDGSTKTVEINWGDKDIDTNEPGKYNLTGDIEGHNHTVTINLIIKKVYDPDPEPEREIKSVAVDNIEIEQGEKYQDKLPSQAIATFDDGKEIVTISWEYKEIDTNEPNSYILTAEVDDYDYTVRIILTIIEEDDSIDIEIDWETAPKAPTDLTAENTDEGIKVSWNDEQEGIVGYYIYRSISIEGEQEIINPNYELIDDSEYIDEDVTEGAKYYYWVRGYGQRADGEGNLAGRKTDEAVSNK